MIKAREGDFIETGAGWLFDVKGFVHPQNRVIAFPRYFPREHGIRRGKRIGYSKVYSFSERYALLNREYPQYVVIDPVFDEMLCEVPIEDIRRIYAPARKLRELRSSGGKDPLEEKALSFAELIYERSKVPWKAIGVSGSLLVQLHTMRSDIDLVVYGAGNCRRVYSALRMLVREGETVRPYRSDELPVLFDFRSKDTAMSFGDFVRTESRKIMQGKFLGTDYFFRFVKDWNEINEKYGDVCYKNSGTAEIEAEVIDDGESIFTPCMYQINRVRVTEGNRDLQPNQIVSFRGRFCEHAKNGETVVAHGKIERCLDRRSQTEHCRLLVGNDVSDFVILKRT